MFYKYRFFRHAQRVRLQADEKADARTALLSYMQTHPVRERAAIRHQRKMGFFSSILKPVPLTLITCLGLGAGTAFAAEPSLPHDLLYPIKTHITEPIRGALALTPKARSAWTTHLVERRLGEAKKLAEQQRLDELTREALTQEVERQTEHAKKIIEVMRNAHETGADEANHWLDVATSSHEKIFQHLRQKREKAQRESERTTSTPPQKDPRLRDRQERLHQEKD
jgi:hypothetical protein